MNKAPDTFVKLNLVSSTGHELAHSKTTVRRGQPNPLFKETFIFQVSKLHLKLTENSKEVLSYVFLQLNLSSNLIIPQFMSFLLYFNKGLQNLMEIPSFDIYGF